MIFSFNTCIWDYQ